MVDIVISRLFRFRVLLELGHAGVMSCLMEIAHICRATGETPDGAS